MYASCKEGQSLACACLIDGILICGVYLLALPVSTQKRSSHDPVALCPYPGCVQQAASVTFSEVWPISSVMASCDSQLSWLLTFCKTMRCELLINKRQRQSNTQRLRVCRKKPKLQAPASHSKNMIR